MRAPCAINALGAPLAAQRHALRGAAAAPPPLRTRRAAHAASLALPRRPRAPAAAADVAAEAERPGADGADAALLDELRELLLDPRRLLRAVATASPSRPRPPGARRRLELRPVRVKGAVRLGAEAFTDKQSFSSNAAYDDGGAAAAVEQAIADAFDNWRVEASDLTLTLSRNRRGALAATRGPAVRIPARTDADALAHDRAKPRLLAPSDPLLVALGISSPEGNVKAAKADKFIQVEEFLRIVDGAVADALATGRLPPLTPERPLRLVDLGCGNAYLTFAAYALLARTRGLPTQIVGVDVKAQARERNSALAARLGWSRCVSFVEGSIADAAAMQLFAGGAAADVVLALHACDTATDDALAAAVRWRSPLVLAAPCCQHSVQAQLKKSSAGTGGGGPFPALTRHGLLRERFGDVLTDAIRASLMRLLGFRVDALEFCSGDHTPRNVLLRAVRTGAPPPAGAFAELDALCAAFGLQPALAAALGGELAAARARGEAGAQEDKPGAEQ